MKKIVLLLLLLINVSAYSQQQEHLQFMGIPITGQKEYVAQELIKKGFKKDVNITNSEPTTIFLEGRFVNRDAYVSVVENGNDIVWKILVLFEHKETWNSLLSEYNSIKELYSKKYGEPDFYEEYYKDNIYRNSGVELYALNNGWIKYTTYYKVANGIIGLFFAPIDNNSASVIIVYEDEMNAQQLEEQILNDI